MVNAKKISAVLFDFDGVVMDTESQYSEFWDEQGAKYLNITDFGMLIKGTTLNNIFDKYFHHKPEIQQQLFVDLKDFEKKLKYEYIPGFKDFVCDLKDMNILTGVVTSSNRQKIEKVFFYYPDFRSHFDIIVTADDFTKSKPDPECFMLAMKELKSRPQDTFIFEDSIHGLEAAIKSKAIVVGLTTTNSYEKIVEKAHYIIKNFEDVSYNKLVEWRGHKD